MMSLSKKCPLADILFIKSAISSITYKPFDFLTFISGTNKPFRKASCIGLCNLQMNADEKLISILKGCLKNKRSSQKELYQHFYAYGMSIGLRYAGNEDEAVMILNDGFMKVFKYLKNFDLEKPFKPWFRRIIVNTAIDHYNVAAKHPVMNDVEDVHEADKSADAISGISYQEIVALMSKLPPSYRAVFNLYVIEGYSHDEIADKLGVSVGTTKSNLFKAKRKMQEMLEELFEVT